MCGGGGLPPAAERQTRAWGCIPSIGSHAPWTGACRKAGEAGSRPAKRLSPHVCEGSLRTHAAERREERGRAEGD